MSILCSSKLTIVRRSLQLHILKSLIALSFGEYTKNLIPCFQHTVNCSYYFIVGKLNVIYSYCCLELCEYQLDLAIVLEPKFDQKLHRSSHAVSFVWRITTGQQFSKVYSLIDHRNDVKMFKTQVEPREAGELQVLNF